MDGSDFLNRSWAEFKVGFKDKRGNYWLGNDLLSQLTQQGNYQLSLICSSVAITRGTGPSTARLS